MNKVKKQDWIKSFNTHVASAKSILVANFYKLTVKEIEAIRHNAHKNGVKVQVVVNSLAKIALQDTVFSGLSGFVKDQSIVFISSDSEVSCAALFNKIGDFEGRLMLRCVGLENQILNKAESEELGSLPSIEVIRSKILGVINMSIARVPTVIQAVASALVRVIDAKVKKG